MAEPNDMILPLLREMRAENAALHDSAISRLDAIQGRLADIECDMVVMTEMLMARCAAVRASRRRPLAGSSA